MPDGQSPAPPGPDDEAVLDRTAALAAGGKIPGKVIGIAVACFVVLGLGGVALDHVFPGPVGASATVTSVGNYPPPFPAATAAAPGAGPTVPGTQLPASSPAIMGLQHLGATVAPTFSLVDQHGHLLTLRGLRGKVVVLSFFDATCDDICTVLENELSHAYVELGPDAARVVLVTVNTDPLALTMASARRAAARKIPSKAWYFLTGSLPQLNPVWKSYGIGIEVQRRTGSVSHNNLLYFIDPLGRLRLRATPFANESPAGAFGLPEAAQAAWASGIADQARNLLGVRK